MRLKKIVLRDTLTRIGLIILQFEEADETFARPLGFGAGMKIVLKFSGSSIIGITDYKLNEALYISDRNHEEQDPEIDRTMVSFGQLLDRVDNVLHLPDEINVKEVRSTINELIHTPLFTNYVTEELENYNDHSRLRKLIFENHMGRTGTAMIDIIDKELSMHYTTTADRQQEIARYLWIPVKEATEAEIADFKEELDFKDYVLRPKLG